MAALARKVGLYYNFNRAILNNTLSAHRLLHFAKEKAVQNELKERLFKAYYTEGKDVADRSMLARLAAGVGLDADEARTVLEENRHADEERQDQEQAYQVDIQGAPFFVFNNKYAVWAPSNRRCLPKC